MIAFSSGKEMQPNLKISIWVSFNNCEGLTTTAVVDTATGNTNTTMPDCTITIFAI